jgi:hypothetical protein
LAADFDKKTIPHFDPQPPGHQLLNGGGWWKTLSVACPVENLE